MVEIKHLCLCLLFSSTHFSVYKDTFAFYKDTKCVQGHAILMRVSETGRYQQNLGIENGRYQHILVSKQVSVSADTNVQSIGIGIELKILVSPNTITEPLGFAF